MKGKNKTTVMFSTPTFNTTKPQDILVRFDKKMLQECFDSNN